VLLIRCAACREKLWKYEKRGAGEVLRCHKDRMDRVYALNKAGDVIRCRRGKTVGRDRGTFIRMKAGAFVYSGRKENH
jgi:hypothetical protein